MDVSAKHELLRWETGDDPLFVITHEIIMGNGFDSGLQKSQEHGRFSPQRMSSQTHTVFIHVFLLCQPLEPGPAAENRETNVGPSLEDHLQGKLLPVIETFLPGGFWVGMAKMSQARATIPFLT